MEANTRRFFFCFFFILSTKSILLFIGLVVVFVWRRNEHTSWSGCCCVFDFFFIFLSIVSCQMWILKSRAATAIAAKIKLILWQLSEFNSWKPFKITAHKILHIVLSAKNVGLSVFHDAKHVKLGGSYTLFGLFVVVIVVVVDFFADAAALVWICTCDLYLLCLCLCWNTSFCAQHYNRRFTQTNKAHTAAQQHRKKTDDVEWKQCCFHSHQ